MKKSKCCNSDIQIKNDINFKEVKHFDNKINNNSKSYIVCRKCGMICETNEVSDVVEEGEIIIKLPTNMNKHE